jgi:hypothetical protein
MQTTPIRIGAEFSYNNKRWRITGFSSEKVFFQSLDGRLQSQVDQEMFLQVAEFVQPAAKE